MDVLVPLASTVRADFGPSDDPTYVFDICASGDGATVATSCSTHCIKLYTAGEAGMEHVGDLRGHQAPIRQVDFPLKDSPSELYSCSADGSVLTWDVRTKGRVAGYAAQPGQELNSFSVGGPGGNIVAAGAIGSDFNGGSIYFWDRRAGKRLATFFDCHTEGVTQVIFHPAKPSALLTGSIDGLVNVFDISGGRPDEDENLVGTLNVDVAVVKMGLGGRGGELLWVLSGNESLHFYDWEGLEPCGRITDARGAVAHAIAATPAGPLFPEVHYIVQCDWDPATGGLWMLAGTNAGSVAACPVVGSRVGSVEEGAVAPPVAVLHGGHEDVVRSVLWASHAERSCVSGGEDSRLCLWSASAAAASTSPPGLLPAANHGARRQARGPGGGQRHSPY